MSTFAKEIAKPVKDEDLQSQADDAQQIVPPPEDSGYNDEPDEHRGLSGTGKTGEIPPRNQWSGQPGFDWADQIRHPKGSKV